MSVGLVLVAHSRRLADGLRELIESVTQGGVPLAVAAGGEEEGALGTSAAAIAEALESLPAPDGMVVLMDLGSAVLSAETALELVPALRGRVRLADAPFVEGAVAAAVEASLGSGLEEVLASAEAARAQPKLP